MSKADQTIERAADRLQGFIDKATAEGGIKAQLAEPLASDPDFIRKLKPSLIKARAQGQAPTDKQPGEPPVRPSGPQLGDRPRKKLANKAGGGPNPWVVIGIALALGIFLAKWIDWRGHAHPRD